MIVRDPTTVGVIILTLLAVVVGGVFLLRVATGKHPANELQRSYYRAGHAHAGMFVTLGLLLQVILAPPEVPDWGYQASFGVLWAAILMPAGFFLSVAGDNPARPNAFRLLIPLGAISLCVGLAGAGIALV